MKRVLSVILALVMLIGLLPNRALATEKANLWEGRSAVFVGDSITAGSGTTKIYYQYLAESLDFSSVTAMGVSGSCFSAASDYGQNNQPLINRYQSIPSADLIVVFMGTNDYGHETPLGSVEDTQDGSFYGALNVIIPALVATHPSSKIVFVTSLHRYGFGSSKILETKFTYDNIPNGVGATLGDYVDALKTVCANNGVSVMDLYTECTLDPSNPEVRSTYMPDGLHPNAAGHEMIAGIMESHIRGFEPAEQEPIELTELVYGNRFAAGNNQTCRASSCINYYLKAGTVITLKDSAAMQWACTRTTDETSSGNLGYFPDGGWSNKETAVVETDGWVGFVFKYRDETRVFDLTKPLTDYITIEEPHIHSYTPIVTAPTCTQEGYTTYTCICGDSYVDDYLGATGIHSYVNGACTECGAAEWDTDGDGILEILAIGNSFSVDALEYAYQIAQNLGIEKVVIGNLYIGGCSLNTHATNAAGDLAKYTYYYNDSGNWTSANSYKISTALESRSWDYVSMQQASNYSGVESTYNDDLTDLIAYVKARSDAKLVWHMTWAYQQNSTHSAFPTYGKNQMTMYNAIVSAVQNKIVTNSNFDFIVPNGTAVQNSRTSLLGDTTTRDGYHLSYDYGRYLAGLTFLKTITGLSVDSISYAPSGVDAEEKAIAIESANNACANPFAVTDSVYVAEVPEEGYLLLNPDLTKGGYWWPVDSQKYNQVVTDANNSKYFFATPRFTREELPVGSIIVLESGWQYRPDGWVTDTVQSSRADTTTKSFVVVTEAWWSNYTLRGFNISKVGLPSLENVTEEEVRAAFRIYVPEASHSHKYDSGICTLCANVAEGCIWHVVMDGVTVGAYADMQAAVAACEDGATILLTADCAVTAGVTLEKSVTVDGGNHWVDISGCKNAFAVVGETANVTIKNLKLDGGATGFEVDYDAVTYTNYTIPLKSGSLANDPKASQSAIISSGNLVCENVDISNRYTASAGGAMQILAGSVKLTNCEFTHNYGTSKGGALFIGSNLGTRSDYPVELVTIRNCTFTNNYTGHGGAIYAYNMTEMVIENSDFVGNTANGGKGGAIDLFSETTQPTAAMALGLDFMQTTVRGCSFRGNWAGNDGFAIQSYDSDLYIYDSEFVENVGVHPTSSVGTVSVEAYRHADTSWRIYTLMDGCLFERNQGPCAVYGDHSSISDLDVSNCVFRNNKGNDSFLLYAATTNMRNCRFVGEEMDVGVIDARIYENYQIPPLLTITDTAFENCNAPAAILTRKQTHNKELNAYQVVLQGTTSGNIMIWDSCQVTVLGDHTGNITLDYGTQRSSLLIGNKATLNGIVLIQPESVEQQIGKKFAIAAKAEGDGLTYQWYYKDSYMKEFKISSNKTSAYAYTMQSYMHNRQVYCVITDRYGNQMTTDVATITRPPVALQILQQPADVQTIIGQKFSVKPTVQGDGLTYQWYYKDSYMKEFKISSNKTSAYAYTMQSYMHNRQVYCVITDRYGNQMTTDVATITRPPIELKLLSQTLSMSAALGDKFSVSVNAQGDGLTYQWYYKDSYMKEFKMSSNKTSAYAYAMQSYMHNRQVYCVITDQYGNQVTTEVVTLVLKTSGLNLREGS